MIPYGRQEITQADIDAVVDVLRSDFLTQGPAVPRFERALAERTGARHVAAVNSATSALHIACLALGLSPGDRLWTVPNTFVASANCARYCGADVDFVDIDRETWNMSTARLSDKLVAAKRAGTLPKIVVPVHFGGQPTEQEAIAELAREFGFHVIEDASHAIGASRYEEPVGSCRWSSITIFSFHPVKIVTTGEGGAALTNDPEVAARLEVLRTHGITRSPERLLLKNPPPWYYEQQTLGYNYRMTDIQACLGTSQITRLEAYVARRNEIASRYDADLRALPVQLPSVQQGNRSAFHLYVIRLQRSRIKHTHRQVFEALRAKGIGVNLHYTPVHLQPYYRELGFGPGQFPEAESYADEAISLPMYPTLTDEQQQRVVEALRSVL
ncbi:MAG TPA: UDP-4-amino-4,6-dideoxy-N-acetyl-beta-L-altrosamine transaminase [Burkholderiales bacterium]|nr:UDP-4-amino-4,6-dideoxy-N-acetyl-beta-L-altrosamine transaminase [Burkholderiales bacterium]